MHSFYFYQIYKLFTYICSCLIKNYLLQVHSGLAVRGWPVGPNGEHHSSWRGRHRQRRNLHQRRSSFAAQVHRNIGARASNHHVVQDK